MINMYLAVNRVHVLVEIRTRNLNFKLCLHLSHYCD